MRSMRGTVNAVLLVTLVRPIVRRMVARWRQRAQESAASTIGIPVQELLETALIEELASSAADLESATAETSAELAGRSLTRTLLVAGALVAIAAGVAVAVAALIRRRRKTRAAPAGAPEWAAVPVETSSSETEGSLAEESAVR